MGGLSARLAQRRAVVCGYSNLHLKENKKAIWTAKAYTLFSRKIPKKIVCCSEEYRRVNASLGYDKDRMLVIPNGFDLEAFGLSREAQNLLRDELCLTENALLIGC